MVSTDDTGHAIPGPWYEFYLASWKAAFPEGSKEPGCFIEGDKWSTGTPAWDGWWFESRGVKPPRRRHYRAHAPAGPQ